MKQNEKTQNTIDAINQNIDAVNSLNNNLQNINEIISNAGLGIWHIIIKDGLPPRMQVNPKMTELLALDRNDMTEEEIYNHWFTHVVQEEIPSVQVSVQEMMDGKFSENTYKWNHPENGIIYVRCGGTSVTLPDGTCILSGYHSDVTEIVLKRQKQEQALEEAKNLAEAKSREIAEQFNIINTLSKAFNAIYYIDLKDYSFFEVGITVEGVREYIGRKGDARQSFEMMLQHLVTPGQVNFMREFTDLTTINQRLKDRPWISCQFYGPVKGWSEGIFIAADRNEFGDFDHVIWATRTIDETKRKEIAYQKALEKATIEAERANEAKSTFLFNMSHDIRTPMNAIMGYTDLIEKYQNDSEKTKDYLEKIKISSEFLLSLINDVLEMAKIESGKETLEETVFKTGEIVKEVFSVYSDIMKKKNINFQIKTDIKDLWIYGDIVKLKEIFLNIVSNSYKYTAEGGTISIISKAVPYFTPGYIAIQTEVIDTGIGMSKEYLPMIFDEFSREHSATEGKIKGTGLGMPIVKKLVEMMNGTISLTSELGVGTTITITLPHKLAEKPESKAEITDIIDTEKLKGKRILLAEDNDFNAEIATEMLSDYGIIVDRANDGVICVDMMQKSEPGYYSLVLMDIQMPNMDGYKASRAIRAIHNHVKNSIPIIAMTANAFEEDKRNALSAGMNDHVIKPVKIKQLIKTITEFIK